MHEIGIDCEQHELSLWIRRWKLLVWGNRAQQTLSLPTLPCIQNY
jgi:hypothetical protein